MKKTYSFFLLLLLVGATTMSCSSDDEQIQASSLAQIVDFTLDFDGVDADQIEYDLGSDIKVSVPFGTSLTGVVPNIEVSDYATVVPASGEALNFEDGQPVTFTVTAEDGTQKSYTVTVHVRGEVGSGSKIQTYTVADLFGENSTTTYTYNDANFVAEITKEVDDWGELTTTVYQFVYDDHNQIVAKVGEGSGEETTYTYEDGKIVQAVYKVDGTTKYTYAYSYGSNGDLTKEQRTDHTNQDAITEITFVIEDGNVVEENRYGEVYVASYDDQKNPFKELYPSAYGAIMVSIQGVNQNNPISGTLADDTITYEYNEDGYPVRSSYTYFDNLATVEKTFTYLPE